MLTRPQLIRLRRWAIRIALWLIAGVIFLPALWGDALDPGTLYNRLVARTGNALFDYVGWEINALASVTDQQIAGAAPYLTDDHGSAYVAAYLNAVQTEQSLEGQIAAVYTDANVHDPATASADLRRQLDTAQADVAQREPLAESIVSGQVSAVLRDEGFATLGQILPPVAARFTQLPDYLVISARDSIRFEMGLEVTHLSADQADALENRIDHDLNVSSLIVPLGGLSLYPTMIAQSSYAPGLFETVSHEWSHLYLMFFPLGQNYDQPETRIINESTAVLFGQEIGRKTIERFYAGYPDILRQLPPLPANNPTTTGTPVAPSPTLVPGEPPPFDFASALNETRLTVDHLLSIGQVDQAETYMNAQRKLFTTHGFKIRKLNQAFFAFYGGYQGTGGSGAGGTDPTGPAIERLRAHSPSIRAWIEQMRWITTRAELLNVAGQ